ncbi:MAG: beta galactosidase jelly roll domain-containing protein, partial [Candidatus Symbiothrix sp.]|nr:beta galactosidase jelly roll domain-containing protein [Candidatus Symbiothrix sp.]
MKYLGIIYFCCLLCLSTKAQQTVYSLNSSVDVEWKVYPVASASSVGALSSPDYNTSAWITATVPGTFFVDYVNAGLEAKPEYADNIFLVDESKYNQAFWYRAEFEIPASFTHEKIWLNMEGTNKKATVYLNGTQLGIIKGHVQRAKYDISSKIFQTGKNVLLVRIDIPKQRNDRNPQGLDSYANYAMPTYMSSASWDWMPYVPGLNCGITNDIFLSASGTVSLNDTWIRSLVINKTQAELTLSTEMKNTGSQTVTGTLNGVILPGNIQFSKTIEILANTELTVRLDKNDFSQLIINNPRLWWPNGYGEPNLYDCRLTFSVNGEISDEANLSFGIKKYEYKTENTALTFYINGEKVFLKGGNWGISEYLLR